ncbi:MAG: CmcI family methyltransferase [Desulfatiglandales bacterium]
MIRSLLRHFQKKREVAARPLRDAHYDRAYQLSLREWLLYHQKEIVFESVTWMGLKIWKNPLDAWIYQEILHDVRPDVVVEIGSRFGGSTKYFADLLELLGNGVVVSIDPHREEYSLVHERVIALTGKSSEPDILSRVKGLCRDKNVLVIQDGDHGKAQVLEDLENYSGLVGVGSYFIVEDGIVDLFHGEDGLGFREEDPGPLAAVEAFLRGHPEFEVDESRERYILTYNPKGFLKRIGPPSSAT